MISSPPLAIGQTQQRRAPEYFPSAYHRQIATVCDFVIADPSSSYMLNSYTACHIGSLKALPPVNAWDSALLASIDAMSTRQLLGLHKEWLQEGAILLPKAELMGPGSSAYNKAGRQAEEEVIMTHSCCTEISIIVLHERDFVHLVSWIRKAC
jgi:hypothetical protein